MRKLAIAVALASTALATPALARDKAWYVGVEGGAMIVEDIHFDIGATPDAMKIDHNYGYDVGGMVGYDFGMFRVETEVSYKSANVDAISSSLRIPAYNSAGALVQSNAGSYGYAALVDPEFINANARSLLQRAFDAHRAAGEAGVRFKRQAREFPSAPPRRRRHPGPGGTARRSSAWRSPHPP